MTDKIPFIISEAYPDYKRPLVNQIFGTISREQVSSYFIEKASLFIFDRIDSNDLNSVIDVTNFWIHYYDEYCMDNPPWEATVFIDNNWLNVTPSDEEIFERIIKLKLWEAEDVERDCNRQAELSEDEDESIIEEKKDANFYKLTQEEIDIINQMQTYFENEGFNILDEENKTEEVVRLINDFIFKTKNKEFQENKTLFISFTDTLLKCIEKDIEKITSDMEIIHNEENSKKLEDIMNIYGSLLEYKSYFKI